MFFMLLATGGMVGLLAYLFSEASFYQIYSIDIENLIGFNKKVIGILMAFGYAFGVLIQWIISNSDKKMIKMGLLISLIMLLNRNCS